MIFVNVQADTYYMSPSGDDGNNGRTTTTAWATLQHAQTRLSPGDTLLIMGGIYSTPQQMHGPPSGTENNPIVVKAYGDAVAYFDREPIGSDEYYRVFFQFAPASNVTDWFVIDGWSYLDPSDRTRYLVFRPGKWDGLTQNPVYCVVGAWQNSGSCDHITIRGIEIAGRWSNELSQWVRAENCRYWEISHCRMSCAGDSVWAYGYGYGLSLVNCDFFKIEHNYLEKSGHGMIEMGHGSCYNRIRSDTLINTWSGGGFYFWQDSNYNLIEDCFIMRCGESMNYPKPLIQLSASSNSIRNNVWYNPSNQGFDMEACRDVSGYYNSVDSNLIYNNTIYHSRWGYGNLIIQVRHGTITCEGNMIANNIIYKSYGFGGGSACMDTPATIAAPEILLFLCGADEDGNWLEPDQAGNLPDGTHFGGNVFKSNLIRHWASTGSYDSMIVYAPDAGYGGCVRWHISDAEALDPVAWHGNIYDDPLLFSENPDSYGLTSGWWHLRSNSPCIDSGSFIGDWIGAYVESRYPGYGWGNRNYVGSSPDIGAFEYNGGSTAPPSPPSASIWPGNE